MAQVRGRAGRVRSWGPADRNHEACMYPRDPHTTPATPAHGSPDTGPADVGERAQLAHTLASRFAPHVEAAAAAVRDAEQHLADAREELARARQAAANQEYQSDRLVFMRASVSDEVEALSRKTTPKKVRVAYRYLLARAVELAEAEVQGYHADQAALLRERHQSVAACLETERQAVERFDAAREMQGRVQLAEQAARDGLAVMVEKLAGDSSASA